MSLTARHPRHGRQAGHFNHSGHLAHSLPHKGPAEKEEGLELPVDPDQGMPLIPDEEEPVKAPS